MQLLVSSQIGPAGLDDLDPSIQLSWYEEKEVGLSLGAGTISAIFLLMW